MTSIATTPVVGRGLNAEARAKRIAANPKRAAAIVTGRKRLAQATTHLNENTHALATLRLSAGLSQAGLAALTGMKQPNIARLEKHPGDPSLSTLRKLATAFNVDLQTVIAAVDAASIPPAKPAS